MDILIGLIIVILVGGIFSFNKTEKENEVAYKKSVEDTTFNSTRSSYRNT